VRECENWNVLKFKVWNDNGFGVKETVCCVLGIMGIEKSEIAAFI
jgi:hypothetical protein